LCAPARIAPAPRDDGEDQSIPRRTEHQDRRAGDPVGFFLTGGEAHDLVGTRLPPAHGRPLITDKRVFELLAAGKTAVITPRQSVLAARP